MRHPRFSLYPSAARIDVFEAELKTTDVHMYVHISDVGTRPQETRPKQQRPRFLFPDEKDHVRGFFFFFLISHVLGIISAAVLREGLGDTLSGEPTAGITYVQYDIRCPFQRDGTFLIYTICASFTIIHLIGGGGACGQPIPPGKAEGAATSFPSGALRQKEIYRLIGGDMTPLNNRKGKR